MLGLAFDEAAEFLLPRGQGGAGRAGGHDGLARGRHVDVGGGFGMRDRRTRHRERWNRGGL